MSRAAACSAGRRPARRHPAARGRRRVVGPLQRPFAAAGRASPPSRAGAACSTRWRAVRSSQVRNGIGRRPANSSSRSRASTCASWTTSDGSNRLRSDGPSRRDTARCIAARWRPNSSPNAGASPSSARLNRRSDSSGPSACDSSVIVAHSPGIAASRRINTDGFRTRRVSPSQRPPGIRGRSGRGPILEMPPRTIGDVTPRRKVSDPGRTARPTLAIRMADGPGRSPDAGPGAGPRNRCKARPYESMDWTISVPPGRPGTPPRSGACPEVRRLR